MEIATVLFKRKLDLNNSECIASVSVQKCGVILKLERIASSGNVADFTIHLATTVGIQFDVEIEFLHHKSRLLGF